MLQICKSIIQKKIATRADLTEITMWKSFGRTYAMASSTTSISTVLQLSIISTCDTTLRCTAITITPNLQYFWSSMSHRDRQTQIHTEKCSISKFYRSYAVKMIVKHPERDALWGKGIWGWENDNQDLGPNQTECHRATNWGLNLTLMFYRQTNKSQHFLSEIFICGMLFQLSDGDIQLVKKMYSCDGNTGIEGMEK